MTTDGKLSVVIFFPSQRRGIFLAYHFANTAVCAHFWRMGDSGASSNSVSVIQCSELRLEFKRFHILVIHLDHWHRHFASNFGDRYYRNSLTNNFYNSSMAKKKKWKTISTRRRLARHVRTWCRLFVLLIFQIRGRRHPR